MVPAIYTDKGVFYINNYSDWDQYNTWYNKEFLINGIRTANAIANKYKKIYPGRK